MNGNYYTQKRMAALERLLKVVGLEPERVRVEWISAAEGLKFAQVVEEFTETVKGLGPNPLKELSP